MTAAQSLIKFGDYIMPYATVLKSMEVDSTIEDAPLLGMHGAFAPAGNAKGTTITLQIELGGMGDVSPVTGLPLLTLDDANNELNNLYLRLQDGYQQLIVGTTPPRYIMAQKRKFEVVPLEGSGRTHLSISAEFFAQDPRWLSTVEHSLPIPGAVTVTNSGTARSYPVWTITAGTNPQVNITPPGASTFIAVLLTYTLAPGDVIVVDCDPRNRWRAITLNGTPRLDLLGTNGLINNLKTSDLFPFLAPGNSVAQIFGSGTAASIAWADAWGA